MKLHLAPLFRKAVMAAVCAVSAYTLSANTLNIYVLTGQSNSLGSVKGDPASPAMLEEYSTANTSNVQLWNASMSQSSAALHDPNVSWVTVAPHLPVYNGNKCMGPEFGYAYMSTKKGWQVNTNTGDNIAIVKASLDGGPNTNWVAGTVQYKRVVWAVKAALNAIDASQYDSINIAGLMYLQGESNKTSNNAGTMYETLLTDLKRDLADQSYDTSAVSGTSVAISQEVLNKLTISLDQNIAGEPATWNTQLSDTSVSSQTCNELMHVAAARNDVAWVYDRDLPKISSGDNMNVHYNGEAEIAIGARFAYANAVEKGWDVTEGGTISVRSQVFTGAENYPATSAYAATPTITVNLNDDIAWWDGNAANKGNVIAVWDISSANQQDTISADFAVGGIRVEDPVVHTVTINNASGSHTLSVGGSGIEQQKGNLTVNTALATTADQTWTLAGERKLTLNGGISGDHAVGIVRGGDSTKEVQVAVTFGATDSHAWSVGNGVEFSTMGGDSLTLDSLTLTTGATLNIGGKNVMDLTINTLTATGGTFAFNMASADSYDHLTLGNASSLSGDYIFNISVNKKVTSSTYTLVENWTGGSFTGNIECANGVTGTLAQVGNAIVLTLTGTADGTADYINHNWPTIATTTSVPGNGGDFYAGDHGDNTHYAYREDQGANALRFYASKSSGSGDTYAELTDTPCNWLAAFGSGSSSSAITVDGSASLKHSGTRATSHTVYGGVNGTITGNAYLELADTGATYDVKGLYNAHVGGKLTYILNGGTYSNFTAGVTNTTSSTVGKGVYVQIEDGTFNGAVYGGSTVAATIDGGVHMVVNGGTFNGDFLAGNNGGGIINDGVEVIINGGTFKSWVFGAGYNGTVNGDIHMTISGGDFSAVQTAGRGIYAGGGSSSTTVNSNSNSIITLKNIANGNEFLSYTGVLSGGHQNGSATGLGDGTTRTLELDNYTADSINATLTSFTAISAVNGTNTVLPGTGSRGGATSISVDDTSTLKMAAEAGNMGTIHGEGRIEVTAGAGTTGTAFTLGDDWTGTVALSDKVVGASGNNLIYNLNNYGHEGSTIELTGFGTNPGNYSYISGTGTFKSDFVLKEDANGMGFFLNAGSSTATYTFTGAWSGEGDFSFSPASSNVAATFAFQGDMSKYDGDYILGCGVKIKFGNGGNGATGCSVTGLGDISGTNSSHTASVEYNYSNDVSAYNKITGNINLTKKGAGVLTLTNTNDYTGTTTVEAGTLKVESLGRTGTGNVIVKSGASMEQENFKLTGGTADSTIVMLEGQGLGATSSDFQSMTVGAGSTLKMTGAISLASFTTGAGFQGTGNGTITLSGDSSIGTAGGAQSTSSHNYVLTGGTTTFTNVDLTATSGNAIAVDTNGVGLTLAGTVNVSGNISAGQHNTVTVAEGATAKVGSILYATGQQAWSGGISIGANALLELTDTETYSRVDSVANNGTLHLNGAELRLHSRTGGTYTFGALEVTGSAKIMTDWSNATFNIASLTSHGESASLELCNDAFARNAHTINLGTAGNTNSAAAFTGSINVTNGSSYDNNVHDAASSVLVLKEENIAANAVINFSSTSPHANNFSLKVDAATANVAGITTGSLHADDQPVITSASGTKTLGITGSGDYEAKVTLSNINVAMSGSGTQTFTGDATGVKGIDVSNGALAFVDAGTISGAAVSISGTGKLILGHTDADSVTLGAVATKTASIENTVTLNTTDGTIGGSGTISNAKVDFTGAAGQTVSSDVKFEGCAMTNSGGGDVVIKGDTPTLSDVSVETGSITYESESAITVETGKSLEVSNDGALSFSKGEGENQAVVTITAQSSEVPASVGEGVTLNSAEGGISGTGTVSDAKVEFSGTAEQTVGANISLNGCSIINNSSKLVSINVRTNDAYTLLQAEKAAIALLNVEAISVGELKLAAGQVFSAFKGGSASVTPETSAEATVTLTTLTAATNTTLNANLVFGNASGAAYTLNLKGTVAMGSSLSLYSGGTLNVDDEAVDQILFNGVDELYINGELITQNGEMFACKLFTNAQPMSGIRFSLQDDGWQVAYYAHIPEPATATLSLLALAALAARRRRKEA